VVRSVGNASESNSRGNRGDDSGRKPEDTRPLPRASGNGIAHAAANSAVGELRVAAAPEAPAPEAATAPARPEPPAEIPQQVDQVASAVIERVEAGGGEARIHLEPLELGEVTIHVRIDGDEVRIEIRAERPDVARLLRDHSQDLSSLLGSRGLNLSDVNVGVGGGNANGPFENQREQPRPVAGDFAAVLPLDDDRSSANRHNRLRAAYNPDGALLYRV
jgi:flagellar hook-length control protein FliK